MTDVFIVALIIIVQSILLQYIYMRYCSHKKRCYFFFFFDRYKRSKLPTGRSNRNEYIKKRESKNRTNRNKRSSFSYENNINITNFTTYPDSYLVTEFYCPLLNHLHFLSADGLACNSSIIVLLVDIQAFSQYAHRTFTCLSSNSQTGLKPSNTTLFLMFQSDQTTT